MGVIFFSVVKLHGSFSNDFLLGIYSKYFSHFTLCDRLLFVSLFPCFFYISSWVLIFWFISTFFSTLAQHCIITSLYLNFLIYTLNLVTFILFVRFSLVTISMELLMFYCFLIFELICFCFVIYVLWLLLFHAIFVIETRLIWTLLMLG